jgi:hypothetical protein
LEVIQAALALTTQEGDLVSLDLASFEVFYLRYYSEVLVPRHSVKALRSKTWAFQYMGIRLFMCNYLIFNIYKTFHTIFFKKIK